MRNRSRWSDKEIVIALNFPSRGIQSKSLRSLMMRLGFKSSHRAIEAKVASLRQCYTTMKAENDLWDQRSVDKWIDDLFDSHEAVSGTIRFSSEDAKDVAAVGSTSCANHNTRCSRRIYSNQSLEELSQTMYKILADSDLLSPTEYRS